MARKPSKTTPLKPMFFRTAADFRAWLQANGAKVPELLVGYYKVDSGKPSMTWPESVDEALCFGWIDGVRRRMDDSAYTIRFTPRRSGSIWSSVNVARVAVLEAAGRMAPAGLAAFARRIERKTSIYAYEQQGELRLPDGAEAQFRANPAAWDYFQQTPPSYRKVMTHWIARAVQPATRLRRLEKLIGACASGRRLLE